MSICRRETLRHRVGRPAPLLILSLLVLAAAGTASAQDDDAIAEAVRGVVLEDPRIALRDAKISVRAGVVSLGGEVGTLAEKRYAVAAVERLLGVLRIEDRLVVRSPRIADRDVERAVRARLAAVSTLSAGSIEATVRDGVVVLKGDCPSWWEWDEADRLASEAVGVRAIENRIIVRPTHAVRDSLVTAHVVALLGGDVYLETRSIRVETADGVVRLSGTVRHPFERSRAARMARTAAGVRSVVNDIELGPTAVDETSSPDRITDASLRREILDELRADSRVSPEKVEVEVSGGVVTLRGTVPFYRQREIAEQAVQAVAGLVRIDNRLEVRGSNHEDAAIAADVRTLFESDYLLSGTKASARVLGGRVRLVGEVPDYVMKLRAGALASHVRGVQSVTNDIKVSWNPKMEDVALAARVRRHLATNSVTAGFAKGIRVSAKEGTIRLEGHVSSDAAHVEAGRVALLTKGVYVVDNRLVVVTPSELLELQRLLPTERRPEEPRAFDADRRCEPTAATCDAEGGSGARHFLIRPRKASPILSPALSRAFWPARRAIFS